MIATAFDYAGVPTEAVTCPVCAADNPSHPRRDRYGFLIGISVCACGMVYLNPRMTAEGYAEFYREAYRPLVEAISGPMSLQDAEGRGRMLGHLLKGPVTRLLDVGGGSGRVAVALADAVGCPDVTVIDPNVGELAQARARGCTTICGLVETLPPSLTRYDLIVSLMTSDHWLDPLAALRWMRGALAAGGRLVVDMVDAGEFRKTYPLAEWTKVDHPLYWSPQSFHAALTRTGWRVTRHWAAMNKRRRIYECKGV